MSSIKLSDTQNFCAPFVNWLDLTAGIDDNPLIGAANLALQTIVSPPFLGHGTEPTWNLTRRKAFKITRCTSTILDTWKPPACRCSHSSRQSA